MEKQKIENFINHGYRPYSRKENIKRIIFMWLLSFVTVYIGEHKSFWLVLLCTTNIFVSFVLGFTDFKHRHSKLSRYICDATTCSYYSVLLNILSYKLLALNKSPSLQLCIILLTLLVLSTSVSLLIVFKSIKANKYSAQQSDKKAFVVPLIGSICGFCAARFLLPDLSQEAAILLVAVISLFLSLIIGIGSINFLKAFWYYKTTKVKGE